MIVLGIDTSGSVASAAVLTPAGVQLATSNEPRGHGRVLPQLIRTALADAGTGIEELSAVAVARGPGLFTGMRVGLALAQMIGLAAEIPVGGVSTLRALAARVREQYRPDAPFAVLVDARRREVFAATFDPQGVPLDEPRALTMAALYTPAGIALLPETLVFTDAAAPQAFPGRRISCDGLAAEVAMVFQADRDAGGPGEPATPLYVRRPDTTAANPARSVLGRT